MREIELVRWEMGNGHLTCFRIRFLRNFAPLCVSARCAPESRQRIRFAANRIENETAIEIETETEAKTEKQKSRKKRKMKKAQSRKINKKIFK